MIRTIGVASATLLTLVSGAVAIQAQEEVAVHGSIVASDTGQPVAGRVAVFMSHDGGLVSDNTGADETGAFALAVQAVPHRMLVWAEGYAPREFFDVEAGDGMTVSLDPLRHMTLQLVAADGSPLPGVSVVARYGERGDRYLPNWLARGLEEQHVTTDAEGMFEIRDVVPGVPVLIQPDHFGESILRVPGPERGFKFTRQGETSELILSVR